MSKVRQRLDKRLERRMKGVVSFFDVDGHWLELEMHGPDEHHPEPIVEIFVGNDGHDSVTCDLTLQQARELSDALSAWISKTGRLMGLDENSDLGEAPPEAGRPSYPAGS